WPRARALILAADGQRASAVSTLLTGLALLGRPDSLRYIEDTVPFIVNAINARPCETIEEMEGVFWTCLGYSPRPFRHGFSPEEDQERVAKRIVEGLQPEPFARALERAVPRDLENAARSFEVIRDIDRYFVRRVADCLSEPAFLSATCRDWRRQSDEL